MNERAILDLAIRRSPAAWFEVYGRIHAKNGELVRPLCNVMQRKMDEIDQWCRDNEVPCRIILLKPRQKGASTFSTALFYHRLRNFGYNGCIIGGEYSQTENLWNKVRSYAKFDKYQWPNTFKIDSEKVTSSHGATATMETAQDPDAGRSGTIQVLICTEVARWSKGGAASAQQVLTGILACVPPLPGTLVIEESTAQGIGGPFYEKWQGAQDFEKFKKNPRKGNGYIKIFAPWFAFDDSNDNLTIEEAAHVQDSMTIKEMDLVAKYNLTPGQIAWRRRTIIQECQKSDDLFDQEYPSDEVTAFITSGRRRFHKEGMDAMAGLVKKHPYTIGAIDVGQKGSVTFRTADETDGWMWLWEHPKEGMMYLLSADPAVGDSQTSGDDPDAHSVFVIRAGYWDMTFGRWMPPRTVARVSPPSYVDIDLLSEWVYRMSLYYGNCLIVPEMNNSGLALVTLLKQKGANLYEREVFDKRESTKTTQLGWQTSPKTRMILIENLASAIRDYDEEGTGIEILCPHAVQQLRTFVVKKNGRAEAEHGCHDDDVLSIAIGLTCINGATVYRNPRVHRELPRDLRHAIEREKTNRNRTFSA